MEKLPTANGLYKALIKAGILYWDEVEAFEGVLVLRFKVSEAPDFGTRDDWVPQCCDTNVWAIFSKLDGWEWKDENQDYLMFETEAEANVYLDKFFSKGE
jgi:hypothetical protein